MNKHVLALSTALSIIAFTPAFAQEQQPAQPAVDCTQPANANDPACVNQQQNTQQNTQTEGQSGTTTTTTTDPNASQTQTGQSGTTTTTDPNAAQTQTGQTGTEATDSGTGSTVTTTTTTGTATQAGGDLIVPADQLNSAQVMSANDYIGKTVYDQAGNNIGEVNDLIVSGDGNIEAVILGVGGFLGIGEKDVAVNTQAVQMVQDGDTQRLVVQASKETLDGAPSYDRTNRRYADQATGAGGGTTTETTGSTTAPAPGTTGAVDCTLPENANNAACANQNQQQNQQQQSQ